MTMHFEAIVSVPGHICRQKSFAASREGGGEVLGLCGENIQEYINTLCI
jgi:hypothetical protein